MSFHSSEVFFGGVPNNKKSVIITTSKNLEIKFALLLNIVVAQFVIGKSKIVFLIVALSILTSNDINIEKQNFEICKANVIMKKPFKFSKLVSEMKLNQV